MKWTIECWQALYILVYVECNQWNIHCSTINLTYAWRPVMQQRVSTSMFGCHLASSLILEFYNSRDSFIHTTKCKYLLLHRTVLFQKICVRGRLNSLIPLGYGCRMLVHRSIHTNRCSVEKGFCALLILQEHLVKWS